MTLRSLGLALSFAFAAACTGSSAQQATDSGPADSGPVDSGPADAGDAGFVAALPACDFPPLDGGSTCRFAMTGALNATYDCGVFVSGYATNGVVATPQPGYTEVYIAAIDQGAVVQGTYLTVGDFNFVELEAKTYDIPELAGGINVRESPDQQWDAQFGPNLHMYDQGLFSLAVASAGTAIASDAGQDRETIWLHARGTLAAELLPSRSGSNTSSGKVDVCVSFSDSAGSAEGLQQFVPDAGEPGQFDGGSGSGCFAASLSDAGTCTSTLECVTGFARCPATWTGSAPMCQPGSGITSSGACGTALVYETQSGFDDAACFYDSTSLKLVASLYSTDTNAYCARSSSCVSAGVLPPGVTCTKEGGGAGGPGCNLSPVSCVDGGTADGG